MCRPQPLTRLTRIRGHHGFTVVELLFVIVIIAVLAAITIVAYNGVQQRAQTAAISASLNQAMKKVELYQSTNYNAYPPTLAAADISDANVTYQYTASSTGYCITGTKGGTSLFISNTQTSPTSGGCPGHRQGGVAAITNIVTNPRGVGSSTGWFVPLSTQYVTETTNVSWDGRSDWHRFVWNSTGYSTTRLLLNLSDLTNGATYTFSVLLGNSGTSAISGTLDLCDATPVLSFTLQPGESKRVSSSASRATYDNTYRFLDINPGAGSAGVLVTDVMVTPGTTQYNYADGDSPYWIWNGAANASTSTGPAL